MADPTQPEVFTISKFMMEVVVSIIGSALSVAKWVSGKLTDIDARIDEVEKEVVSKNVESLASIATLKAYHESNVKRFDGVERALNRILNKLDHVKSRDDDEE